METRTITAPHTLDSDAVKRVLPNVDVLETLRKMFSDLAEGHAVQPAQSVTIFPEGKGDFITYLGVLEEQNVFGAKLSPYIVTADAPIISAWTCLMSMETGQPLLLCDSGQLTVERTAGTTALAVDYLASSAAATVSIIGSGKIAQAHWRHIAGIREWKDVRVWSPSLRNDAQRMDEWAEICPNYQIAESAADATNAADVIMLCTSSGTPVIDATAIKNGALVTSISTNVPQAHEVSPDFVPQAQVYCDYRATTPGSAGELVLASKNHGWDPTTLKGDLAELVAGTCPMPNTSEPVFFRSIGLGLEDVAMADAVYRAFTVK